MSKALDRIDKTRTANSDKKFDGEHSTEAYSKFDVNEYRKDDEE